PRAPCGIGRGPPALPGLGARGARASTPSAASTVRRARIPRRRAALTHSIVAHDRRDTKPIIGEDRRPSLALGFAMGVQAAPMRDRGLVAPEREGKKFARPGEALEAFDRDEALDPLEQWMKLSGQIEIGLAAPRNGLDLEDHRDHGRTSLACGAEASFT